MRDVTEGGAIGTEGIAMCNWCRVGDVEVTFGRKIRKRFGSHSYGTVN